MKPQAPVRAVVLSALLMSLVATSARPVAAASSVDALRSKIVWLLSDSTSASPSFAVKIAGLPGIGHRGWEYRRPASTQKLYTALVALLRMGPDARLRTEVGRTGDVGVDGTLKGDLVLVGGGDPLMSRTRLLALARAVKSAGISKITGALWGDDTRYDRRRTAPGWRSSYVPDDIGPLSALAVAKNRWRTDSTYVSNPVWWNVRLFREYLASAGATVTGGIRVGKPSAATTTVTSQASVPVSSLVRVMLKHSDNFVAEMLLKELGRRIGVPTTAGGVTVIKRWAKKLGSPLGPFYDGSGLSLYNREAPWFEVDWLGRAMQTPVGRLFRESLPVGCEYHSTLRRRFCGTAGEGRVWAKTGNLAGTITLSGYTVTRTGRDVRFAFLLPGCRSYSACRSAIDAAVVRIRWFSG